MKKILFVLTLMCSLFLSSCDTMAQIMVDEYYDYGTSTIVVYRDNIAYYRLWDAILGGWRYDVVPYDRMPFIRHRRVPAPSPRRWGNRPTYRPSMGGRPNMGGSSPRGSIGGGMTPRGNSQSHSTSGSSPRGSIGGGFSSGHSQGGRR